VNIIPSLLPMALNLLPFLVAIVGMYYIILKPMVAYLEERETAISQGLQEAEKIEAQIKERMVAYEAELERAKGEVAALRAERRAEAQAAYDEVLAGARSDAEAQIEAAVKKIDAARAAAATALKASSEDLAIQAAGQVLGRQLAAR